MQIYQEENVKTHGGRVNVEDMHGDGLKYCVHKIFMLSNPSLEPPKALTILPLMTWQTHLIGMGTDDI